MMDDLIVDKENSQDLLFNFKCTSKILRENNDTCKISKTAKNSFACVASSIADEIMEYLLTNNKTIEYTDIFDAIGHLDFSVPLYSRQKHLSIHRLMQKYRRHHQFSCHTYLVDSPLVLRKRRMNTTMHTNPPVV